MTTMIQLNPSIPMRVVQNDAGFPEGTGECVGWGWVSKEDYLVWFMVMDDTGQCWQVTNPFVRGIKNASVGRTLKGVK